MDRELRAHLEATALSPDVIEGRRTEVRASVLESSSVMQSGNFDQIAVADLHRLYRAYDRAFFDALLSLDRLTTQGVAVRLRLSGRMTRAAGLTRRQRLGSGECVYDLGFSLPLLWQSFAGSHRPISVSGRRCRDRLDALQRVFEHELLHLVEFLAYDGSSCKRPRFRYFATSLFGHTASTHDLVTIREVARRSIGVDVGSLVEFEYRGETLVGHVERLIKRATVRVEVETPDGCVVLRTFYVPLGRLRAAGP